MYDLKEVIKANTVDDVVDYVKVMELLDNDYVNPIVAKKTDKEKLSTEAVSNLVKELGLNGVESTEDLKLYVKKMGGSTDEAKEANILLELSLKELQGKYDGEVDIRTKLETVTKTTNERDAIKALGIEDKDVHYNDDSSYIDYEKCPYCDRAYEDDDEEESEDENTQWFCE